MNNTFFYSTDGDWVLIPQQGDLYLDTEMGRLLVKIGEFAVIPRGIKFRVQTLNNDSKSNYKGWICEVYSGHLFLPELGPIGANGLSNPQDFEVPVARYDKQYAQGEFQVYAKFLGEFFVSHSKSSPLDVVAWRGNYYPFKYDFRKYNAMNTVTYDHPDPSIFTVMTCAGPAEGVAALDLVIFKQRYMVAEKTFRPPYFHRNTMAEFMGNIYGEYDAKPSGGFTPGCSSLHSPMTAHGPETEVVHKAVEEDLKPVKYKDTMSFMFESCYVLRTAKVALKEKGKGGFGLDKEYAKCWDKMPNFFEQREK